MTKYLLDIDAVLVVCCISLQLCKMRTNMPQYVSADDAIVQDEQAQYM